MSEKIDVREELQDILEDKALNLSLLDISSERYDNRYQNILKSILKIKQIVENENYWHK